MLRILFFLLSSSPLFLFGTAFRRNLSERLHYEYNDAGEVVSIESADGTVSYAYFYDMFGRPVKAVNRKTGEVVKRIYDKFGSLLEETFPSDFTIKNIYDAQGRREALLLPDLSSIEYIYAQSHLQQVVRKSKVGEPLYTHAYAAYDEFGRVLEQEMAGNVGTISSLFDEHGRCVSLSTPFGSEQIEAFDEYGNVLKMDRFSGHSTFSYDEKNQLIQENLESFSFNGHGEYDSHGNTIIRGNLILAYDAFDRLTSIEDPGNFLKVYTYDGFHRRLSETEFVWEIGAWSQKSKKHFLYDHQNEIGALNEAGEIVELRVLGRTQNGDIGSAVALELEGKYFAPVHDLSGNIALLISLETSSVAEHYIYNAFGEIGQKEAVSPWRFSSKRCDAKTGLAFFGRRYYDPQVRKWLTQDPNYPADGIDPYTFVHNNPLMFIDLYGTESVLSQVGFWVGTIIQQYCYHVIPFPGIRYLGIYLGELLGAVPIPEADYQCFSGSVGTIRPEKNHVNVWINGVNTNLKCTIQCAEIISTACGGEKVYFAYNSTKGFMADIWEHIAGKLFFQTSALFVALNTLEQAIQEVGGVNGGGRVTVFAHSQGGAILARAIEHLSIKKQQMLEIYTFGTAALFSKGNVAEIHHFISERDYIPFFADPMRYLLACVWGSSTIHFIPSDDGNTFDNHAILGPLYQNEILKIGAQGR
jgi:RHS repeat-associated protein